MNCMGKAPAATQWNKTCLLIFLVFIFQAASSKLDLCFFVSIYMTRASSWCSPSSSVTIATQYALPVRPCTGAWCAHTSECSSLTGTWWSLLLFRFTAGSFGGSLMERGLIIGGVWSTRAVTGDFLCSSQPISVVLVFVLFCFFMFLLCCQPLQPTVVDFKSKLDSFSFFRSEFVLSYFL